MQQRGRDTVEQDETKSTVREKCCTDKKNKYQNKIIIIKTVKNSPHFSQSRKKQRTHLTMLKKSQDERISATPNLRQNCW